MSSLDAALHAYRDGEISFDELARATAEDWQRLAGHLMGKWHLPVTVTTDDVEQELLLACWQHVGRWDSDRGVTLSRYVVWNACALAVAFIHRQREAHRRRGTSPSRHPVLTDPPCAEEAEARLYDGEPLDFVAPAEMLHDRNFARLEAVDEAFASASCNGWLAERCLAAFLDSDAVIRDAARSVFGHSSRCGQQMVRRAVEEAVANAG